MKENAVGMHYIVELYGCPYNLLNDEFFIRRAIQQASHHGMSTLLKLSSHSFTPFGVTAIGLLAESHLSIHTWPEYGYAAIDYFTCGEHDPRPACEWLATHFSSEKNEITAIPRGRQVAEPHCNYNEFSAQELEPCRMVHRKSTFG